MLVVLHQDSSVPTTTHFALRTKVNRISPEGEPSSGHLRLQSRGKDQTCARKQH